jgi:hypothetical protein
MAEATDNETRERKEDMSRYYEMSVEIMGHDAEKESQIKGAAEEQWPFADWYSCGEDGLQSSAQDSLCGGESEEQFTERLSLAIWRANGGFCEVVVNATYMENLPYEIHTLNEADYERLMQHRPEEHAEGNAPA